MLTVRKLSYSRAPWRVGLLHDDGSFQELAFAHFDRKRDALPLLAQLEALALPWDTPAAQWPEAQRQQVQALIQQTPGYQSWRALTQTPRAPGSVAQEP